MENTKVILTIPVKYNTINRNNSLITKEALCNMFFDGGLMRSVPISIKTETDGLIQEKQIIGWANIRPAEAYDVSEDQTMYMEFHGELNITPEFLTTYLGNSSITEIIGFTIER